MRPEPRYEPPKEVRRFTSSSGREWTVEVYEVPAGVGVRTPHGTIRVNAVLRFTSGDVTLDLPRFPVDWPDMKDHSLMALLRLANAPAFAALDTAAKPGVAERSS